MTCCFYRRTVECTMGLLFPKYCLEHIVLFLSLKSVSDTATLNKIKPFYINKIKTFNVSQGVCGIPCEQLYASRCSENEVFQSCTVLMYILLKLYEHVVRTWCSYLNFMELGN